MEARAFLSDRLLFLDGAMGTELQKAGLKLGEHPEVVSMTEPETVTAIHRAYVESGADIIYTNTFGASARKLMGTGYTPEAVVRASVQAAKRAAEGTNCRVALDLGPIGELLEPSGTMSFEEAYGLFQEQVSAGVAAGADLIVIETMTDLLEVKAAVLAAKENSTLPVFVTMTFEENHRTFAGCSASAMALTLEGLGVDAVGINCSLGPVEIYPIMEELAQWTGLPLIVKANAGLPDPETGTYDITAEQFAEQLERYMALGISAVGGCCGTSPAYIAALRERLADLPLARETAVDRPVALCSMTRTVSVDGVRIIGERINPTGKKLFKQALQEGNLDYILAQGVSQAEAGADVLDVNVGLPGIDEREMMVRVVKGLQAVTDLPLQIDSSSAEVIEAALRVYNGKPIVNSVNGERQVMERIFPLIRKYGAAVVGLALDENGIPDKAEERFAIAERIVKTAGEYGIPREDICIDCLTLTASVQQDAVVETLRAVELVKTRLGVKTVLGVSNISFGLPNRPLVNHSFLLLALSKGLDLPILNPNDAQMMDAVRAYNLLYGADRGAAAFIAAYQAAAAKPAATAPTQNMDIDYAIGHGLSDEAARIARSLLVEREPLEVVNTLLIPALDEVGVRFEKGKIFLPQLLQSAQAAQAAFDEVKRAIAEGGTPQESRGKIILATVKGDIHDIGKNIVKVILDNYGFQVIDLGRDVPARRIVDTAKEQNVRLVGLSALMTTTLASMEETIALLAEECPGVTVFVGGAVLTEDYAKKIGAHFYAKDAKQSADIAKRVLGGGKAEEKQEDQVSEE